MALSKNTFIQVLEILAQIRAEWEKTARLINSWAFIVAWRVINGVVRGFHAERDRAWKISDRANMNAFRVKH